jgi:hypothetical protein
MLREITEYLYSFKDREYCELNSFLKEKYSDVSVMDIRAALFKLLDTNRIETDRTKLRKLGSGTIIPEINQHENTVTNLDNWIISARLSLEEIEKMDKESIDNYKQKQPTYQATFNASFAGNFNQGDSTGLEQSINEESAESKELTKKTFEDFP